LLSRRSLLVSAASAMACGVRKSTPFHGYCFVANQGGNSVAAVDLEHFRVRRQILLDASPTAVLAHPKGDPSAYVLAPDAGTVYEIEMGRLVVSRRAKAGGQAISMQMSPAGDSIWVLYRDPAMLQEIELKTMKPRGRIALHTVPDTFEVSWFDDKTEPLAAVCSFQSHTVTLAALRGSWQRPISMAVEPSLAAFRKDNKMLIVGSRSERSLSLFDTSDGKRVVRLPLPLAPRVFKTNEDGWLFVTGDGLDAVVIAFPYSTEIWQTVLAGRAPGAMAIYEQGQGDYLMVANPESANVTILEMSDEPRLLGVVGVGQTPCQILLAGGPKLEQQFVLVLNQGSGDMAVVRMLELTGPQMSSKPRFKSAALLTMIPVGERPVSGAVVAL
jgi:hypothetical protein